MDVTYRDGRLKTLRGGEPEAADAAAALLAIERVIGVCAACFDRTVSRASYPPGADSQADRHRRSAWDERPVHPRRLPPVR
jgi:hypothetical protein